MLIQDILQGGIVYAIAFMAILFVYFKKPKSTLPLFIFFVLSLALGLVQAYVMDLPQGGSDAQRFEASAILWSEGGFSEVLSRYTGPSSWFLTWLIAVLYSIGAPSSLLPNAISCLVTLIGIYFCYRTSAIVWGPEASKAAMAFACIFPTVLLHSALMMREAYVATLFMIGIYFVVRWRLQNSIGYFIAAHLAFFAAIYFHGALVVANLALFLFASWASIRPRIQKFRQSSVLLQSIFLALIGPSAIVAVFMLGVTVPKLGDISRITDDSGMAEVVLARVTDSRGGAAHPSWTLVKGESELPLKLPVRVSYFLFSPFPWDISTAYHLVGLVDSFLYMFLFWGLIRFRKEILSRPELLPVIFVIFCCVVVFSLGTTNFGTGVRHRSKFVLAMIVVIAPYLVSFVRRKRKPIGR